MKKIRLLTMVAYVGLAVAVGFIVTRKSENKNLPVKVSMAYHQMTVDSHAFDGDTLSIFKEGEKYYVEGEDKKYKITEDEYIRCVNKKIYSPGKDEDYLETGDYTNTVTLTYKDSSGERKEILRCNPFRHDIMNLYLYKKYQDYCKNEVIDVYEFETQEEKEKKLNNYRIFTAWNDLCYKYKVKEAQIMFLDGVKEHKFNDEECKFEDVFTGEYDGKSFSNFIGYNSNLKGEEREQYIKNGYIGMSDRLIKLKSGNEVYRVTTDDEVSPNNITDINAKNMYKALIYVSDKKIDKRRYYKMTHSTLNQVVHVFIDNKQGIGVAVLFRTDDFVSRGLLLHEMDRIVKNKNVEKISETPCVVFKIVAFMIAELCVFAAIGVIRSRKKNRVKSM